MTQPPRALRRPSRCLFGRPWILPFGACLALATLAAALSSPATAASRAARCLIESGGSVAYRGPCVFTTTGRDGSFLLEGRNRRGAMYGSILSVSVTMIGGGRADVRGLTTGGINSRWGTARRSQRQRACWVGSDFRICAWGR